MKSLPNQSVSIGIPAFNEEENIVNLLKSLLKQKYNNYRLEKIIVVSDGSTDKTVQKIRSFKNPNIHLIQNKKRLGIGKSQNKILQNTKSDFLVMLDADVLPENNSLILNLLKPFDYDPKLGLVSGATKPVPHQHLFESIISHGHKIKVRLYEKIKKGNNIYLCHGRVRAFSRALYTKIRWKTGASEDAFSYLFCISRGFKFSYAKKAAVYFRSPQNLEDHIKQSKRFFSSVDRLSGYFDISFIKSEYKIPLNLIFKSILFGLTSHIHLTILYAGTVFYTKFISRQKVRDVYWEQSESSKGLKLSYND